VVLMGMIPAPVEFDGVIYKALILMIPFRKGWCFLR